MIRHRGLNFERKIEVRYIRIFLSIKTSEKKVKKPVFGEIRRKISIIKATSRYQKGYFSQI